MNQNFLGGNTSPFYLLQLLMQPKLRACALQKELVIFLCLLYDFRIGTVSHLELLGESVVFLRAEEQEYRFCKINILINKTDFIWLSVYSKLWALTDLNWKCKGKNIKRKQECISIFGRLCFLAKKFCAIRVINRTTRLKIHLNFLTFLLAYTKICKYEMSRTASLLGNSSQKSLC